MVRAGSGYLLLEPHISYLGNFGQKDDDIEAAENGYFWKCIQDISKS